MEAEEKEQEEKEKEDEEEQEEKEEDEEKKEDQKKTEAGREQHRQSSYLRKRGVHSLPQKAFAEPDDRDLA